MQDHVAPQPEQQSSTLSRRDFVVRTIALAAGGLAVGIHWQTGIAKATTPTKAAANADAALAPNAWIRIHTNGIYEFVLDKTEMGQGVMTSLATLVCEDLGLELTQLKVTFAPADDRYKTPEFGMQITGGSTSVKSGFMPLRKAAATTKMLLLQAAAANWNVDVKDLACDRGIVSLRKDPTKQASFAQLADKAATLPVPASAPLVERKDFRLIGKSQLRNDAALKVCGQARFGIDSKAKGSLSAYVVRAPFVGGSVSSFDAQAARTLPGVHDVVQIPRGVAVVAEHWWQAKTAAAAVVVKWTPGPLGKKNHTDIYAEMTRALQEDSGKEFTNRGDLKQGEKTAQTWIEASIRIPFAPHVTMEPQNGAANVGKDSAVLTGPTQGPGIARDIVSRQLGFASDRVTVDQTFIGGGFGRRLPQDYLEDAAAISAKVGRPVHMMYSREDDMQNDYYRPGNVHKLKAGIDAQGKLCYWQHKMAGPSIMAQLIPSWAPSNLPKWLPTAVTSGLGTMGGKYIQWRNDDGTSTEGAADMEYAVDNMHMEYVISDPGIPVGFWRSVGHSFTGFVIETFIDECAAAAKIDPLAFRLQHLAKSPRRQAVLREVAKLAQWDAPAGRHLGIAQVYSFSSYVAQVAEVDIIDNQIKVKKVYVACDCGLVVNPDQVRAQIESAVIFGLSAALYDELTFANGAVTNTNFDNYRVMRMDEVPEIVISLVEGADVPTGIGEPAVPPLAAAVANAVFAATGKRLQELPLKLLS